MNSATQKTLASLVLIIGLTFGGFAAMPNRRTESSNRSAITTKA